MHFPSIITSETDLGLSHKYLSSFISMCSVGIKDRI